MAMAKSEANSKPVLAAEDVHIVTICGRIYCFQVDRVAMLLHSHRFYRDAVVQQFDKCDSSICVVCSSDPAGTRLKIGSGCGGLSLLSCFHFICHRRWS